MRGLRIVELSYNRETAIVSFTASVRDSEGSTTVASYTRANKTGISRKQAHRLVEQRVAELLAGRAPSGRIYESAGK